MRRGWLTGLLLAVSACGPSSSDGHRPLAVSCDAPSPPDSTAVLVQLTPDALRAGGRILLRVDSLASDEGPKLNTDSGVVVQAFTARGPGYGCAATVPVGAWVRGPDETLSRSWIHVKSDRPVQLQVRAPDGTVVARAAGSPGTSVEPLLWETAR